VFAKLVAVVVSLGACGSTLLALRQSRLQVASEIAQTQIRISQEDERLWILRAKIAERVTPEQVEQMANAVGTLRPLVPPAIDEKAKAEAERKLAQAKEREAQRSRPKPEAKPKPESRKPDSKPGTRAGAGRLARGDSQ
jgi:hypothetical protein